MIKMVELDLVRSDEALHSLALNCRNDMKELWPEVDFDADIWAIQTVYKTRMLNVQFRPAIVDFAGKDPSYLLALRCLMCRSAVAGKTKTPRNALMAWRLLCHQVLPLAALRRHHLNTLEKDVVMAATPTSAHTGRLTLSKLSSMLYELARLGVIGHLAWSPSATTNAALKKIDKQWRNASKENRSMDILDRRIEGLSDATKAMLLQDDRLSARDRSAIAATNLLMCAPSRINEPLCLRISDRYIIEDYAKRPNADNAGKIFQAHQLLLMKGSKGADWSGKPILNFMVDLSNVCWNIILELGRRSRTLLKHYEQKPHQLYLPTELEHLRGKRVTKSSLWQISNLKNRDPTEDEMKSVNSGIWRTLVKWHKDNANAVIMVENPLSHRSDGQRNNFSKIPAVTWQAAEIYLVQRVRERMDRMRRVTSITRYDGALSEMLLLLDTERTPYLPYAWNDDDLRGRLKNSPWRIKGGVEKSVFNKLGIQMMQGDKLVDCYIEPHDVRRWLTTKALEARERLSDALINKWANRISLSQLPAYDLRTGEQKADQASVPVPQELHPISAGLEVLAGIENQYGLQTDIAIADGDGLAVTSVDAVIQATENRPVARSGNQIIILYPNRFGICLHHHHETPCRAYSSCSEGCNEQLTVKGHLPTNEEWRRQEDLTNRSIVNQLQALITARQRGLADDPATLDAHLLTLAKGMNVQTMADELIERFHEIKEQVRDLHFRNELEAAFVSRGVVTRLDDPVIPRGALIKYHNPSKHAAPGYERAIDAQHGGRKEMELQTALFHQNYPELAPRALGLKDERHLLTGDEDEDAA